MFRKSRNTEVTSRRSRPSSRIGTPAWPNLRTNSSRQTTFWSSQPPLTTTPVPSPSRSTKVNGESKEPSVSVTQQPRPREEEDGKKQTAEKGKVGKDPEEEKRNEGKGRKKRPPQTGKKGKKRSQDPEVRL